jgi:hypothetical protein
MAVAEVVKMPNLNGFRDVPTDEGRFIVVEAVWVSKTGVEGAVGPLMGTGNVVSADPAGVGAETVKVEVGEAMSEMMAVV